MKKTRVLWRLVAVLTLIRDICSLRRSRAAEARVTAGASCHVEQTNYMGWQAQQVSNPWVKLIFVPQNGGRLMQVIFDGPSVSVCESPLCWETLFPLQQANGLTMAATNCGVLRGKPGRAALAGNSDLLDDGPFEFQVLSQGQRLRNFLDGASRPQTGFAVYEKRGSRRGLAAHQLSRSDKERERASDRMVRAIGLSVQYGRRKDSSRHNQNFWAFSRTNSSSSYLNRYHVKFGPARIQRRRCGKTGSLPCIMFPRSRVVA